MLDGKAFGREVVDMVRDYVERQTAPLVRRIDELERKLTSQPVPRDGRDADHATIEAYVKAAVAALPRATDGKDADPDRVVALVLDRIQIELNSTKTQADAAIAAIPSSDQIKKMVADALATLPRPKDGKDADPTEVAEIVLGRLRTDVANMKAQAEEVIAALPDAKRINEMVVDALHALPPARDGKDADPMEVARLVNEEVAKAVATIPTPAAPSDDRLAALIAPLVEKAVATLPAPLDPIGLAGALIDRSGSLVLTLSNGTQKDLGPVVGKNVEPADVAAMLAAEVAKLPIPRDGRDGFGFDDLDVEHDGERSILLRFSQGERRKEFRLSVPVILDRGPWKEGDPYQKGDAVSFGGSLWIAQEDTADKPETTKAWRLAVKRGRDGKDGVMKTPALAGPVKSHGAAP